MNNYKIAIIGPPGSGKTMIGTYVSKVLGVDLCSLDSYYWEKNWKRREHKHFIESVKQVFKKNQWIIEGDYDEIVCDLLENSDLVIVLYSPKIILYKRLLFRSLARIMSKEKVCGENYENVSFLFSKEGLFRYCKIRSSFYRKFRVGGNVIKINTSLNSKKIITRSMLETIRRIYEN